MASSNDTLTSKDIRSVARANEEFGKVLGWFAFLFAFAENLDRFPKPANTNSPGIFCAVLNVPGRDTSLIVARPGRRGFLSWRCFWFTVPEGFYALVTRHGADVEFAPGNPVWPPGIHIGAPWLRVSHLVTKQSMVFKTSVKECKTKDNVTVQIDITLMLRVMGEDPPVREGDDPKNVRKFVHEVTARGLEKQLNDAQAEAVRTLARTITHTEVYGLRSVSADELAGLQEKLLGGAVLAPMAPVVDDGSAPSEFPLPRGHTQNVSFEQNYPSHKEEEKELVGEHDIYDQEEAAFNVERGANVTQTMKTRLNAQFKPQGIEITDVIIEKITLPDAIEQQMSQKTMVISQNAEQRMQQKYDMLMLEQTEEVKTLKQYHEEEKMELKKDGEFTAFKESLDLSLKRAEGAQVLKQIETGMAVNVALVNAQSANSVQRIRDGTTLETSRMSLSSKAETQKSMAGARAIVQDIEAKAALSCAKLSSRADKVMFQAHGVSAPKMRTANDYETNMRKIKAQDSLASNDKLVVVGTTGGAAVSEMMLADAVLGHGRKSQVCDKARANVLSELAVTSGNALVRLDIGEQHVGGNFA